MKRKGVLVVRNGLIVAEVGHERAVAVRGGSALAVGETRDDRGGIVRPY